LYRHTVVPASHKYKNENKIFSIKKANTWGIVAENCTTAEKPVDD